MMKSVFLNQKKMIETPASNSKNIDMNLESNIKTVKVESEEISEQNSEFIKRELKNLHVKFEAANFTLRNCEDENNFEVEDHKIIIKTETEKDSSNSKRLKKIKLPSQTIQKKSLEPSDKIKVENKFENIFPNESEFEEFSDIHKEMEISSEDLDTAMQITVEEDNKDLLLPIMDSRNDIFTEKVIRAYQLSETKNRLKMIPYDNQSKINKSLKNKVNYKRKKTGNNKKNCSFPGKEFNRSFNLKEHTLTDLSYKLFTCKICQKIFRNKRSKTRHELSHNPDRRFPCKECDKSFVTNFELKKHLYVHTGEKLFVCEICEKRFIRKKHLKSHLTTHTRENQCTCDICRKTLSVKKSLERHMLLHFGKKKFKCATCNKNFLRKFDLAEHLKIHLQEKKFSCEICGKKFTRSSNVKRHKKLHNEYTE